MPTLSTFAAMAARAGVVPRVPQAGNSLGNRVDYEECERKLGVIDPVPHVPRVPLENDTSPVRSDRQVAFEERAAILEYDEELPRPEAERLAGLQVQSAVPGDP